MSVKGRCDVDPHNQQHPGETCRTSGEQAGGANHTSSQGTTIVFIHRYDMTVLIRVVLVSNIINIFNISVRQMNDSKQNGWDGMVYVGEWRASCGCCPVTMDGRTERRSVNK